MSDKNIIDMKKQEEKEREACFARIAEEFSPGVADAIKEHFAIYDERFYLWLADLYDPGKYDEDGNPLGGGFYYSNSARDNEGFLIDVESTNQALNFFRSVGMLRGYDNDYLKAFPEKTVREIVAFTLSLQSPENGYFYHPQWGKDITAGRLSRDIGSAVDILKKFGIGRLLKERQVGALFTDAAICARKAYISGKIENEHTVARGKPHGERAVIITVDYPLIAREDIGKCRIKFLTRDGGFIRLVPDQVKMIERNARFFRKCAGKAAFARAGAADHDNFLHLLPPRVKLIRPNEVKIDAFPTVYND
jgi:hypothetical protein